MDARVIPVPPQAIELAKRFEGFHRVPKSDPLHRAHPYICPAGYMTIGYRACLWLLSLVRKYGKPRREAACLVALELGAARYSHVRDILANGRGRVHAADTPEWTSPQHAHVRGPGYYQ